VGQSGVYEWYYYEPQVDAIIAPLLFSFAGSRNRDDLNSTGIHAPLLYPRGYFYPELKKMGVEPYVFRDSRLHTLHIFQCSDGRARTEFIQNALGGFHQSWLLLEQQTRPTYVHLYFDKIDTLCHEYGPNALQTEAEIRDLFTNDGILL
jgi:predicted AlkP superfamily pyrophosphatase or phosphodiesterase